MVVTVEMPLRQRKVMLFMIDFFFSYKGRIGRLGFALRFIVSYVVLLFVLLLSADSAHFATGTLEMFWNIVGGVIVVAWIIASNSFFVRRLHDMNLSGWFTLAFYGIGGLFMLSWLDHDPIGLFAPLSVSIPGLSVGGCLSTIIVLAFIFKPGTMGENKYGNR